VQDLQTALVERAEKIEGGRTALAMRLGIPERRLALWAGGTLPVPAHIFLTLVDIVLRDDVARASQDRRQEPRNGAHEQNVTL